MVLTVAAFDLSGADPADAVVPPEREEDKIAPGLQRAFERSGDQGQDFWVRFESSPDLAAAHGIDDWVERGQYVVDELQAQATRQQGATVRMLEARGVEFESFWVTNGIYVTGGTRALANRLAGRSEVESLVKPTEYELPEPVESDGEPMMSPQAVEWGIANIGADQVWADGIDGGGIVVASIDTGAQFDHPALVDQYRGNNGDGSFNHDYNWFDAADNCGDAPCDDNGHGTHTMGTMVGDDGGTNQVGVAPGATWITANGCCPSNSALVASAEWMLAPTRVDGSDPDVSKRPHIINNSWGTNAPSNNPFAEDVLEAWAASGIFGVWANGNIGPQCETSGSPGSRILNYSVGAYDVSNTIAEFSSRGPGQDGQVKPDISAPGVNVRSAWPGSEYNAISGTSMAAPHVAGTIALLWSSAPDLVAELATTRDLLDATAIDTPDDQCGGTDGNNNVYGEGRLDAATLLANRSVGTLTGMVTDADTGDPIEGGSVRITGTLAGRQIERTIFTDPDGTYQAGLPAGEYDLVFSKYGYFEQTAAVTLTNETTTTQDAMLEPAPLSTVSGTVTGGTADGLPVYAEVTIPGYPEPLFTDPDTGTYTADVPSGTSYQVTVDPVYQGLVTRTDTVAVGPDDLARDWVLAADLEACVAPGYGWNGTTTTFAGWADQAPSDGWEVTGRHGQWRFDNPWHRQQPWGAEGQFAIAEPGAFHAKRAMTTSLVSPPVDLTGQDAPQLLVDMRYLGRQGQSGVVEYSVDGGVWREVWSVTSELVADPQTIDLPAAVDQPDVRVRFTFDGKADGYWSIDNVFIGTHDCIVQPGGLIVGEVTDATTTDPIPGADIQLAGDPTIHSASHVIPDDPATTGAIYWLFAPTGPQTLSVSADRHDTAEVSATVPDGGVTRADVALVPATDN